VAVDWDKLVIGPTTAIFGDEVCFVAGDDSFDIVGVFDEAYLELTPLGHGGDAIESFSFGSPGGITSSKPVLGVQLSQFRCRPPKQGDTLVVRSGAHAGERFEVKEVRPDGHGAAKLMLNEY
jgi:hypothetical protein